MTSDFKPARATVTDGNAPRFPVSIKGVVLLDDRVVLLRNVRDEWELPGGKLEPGENPPDCLAREIQEELGLTVVVDAILDAWVYNILDQVEVLIVTYGCRSTLRQDLRISSEHKEVGLFSGDQVALLAMPDGYKRSIRCWIDRLRRSP